MEKSKFKKNTQEHFFVFPVFNLNLAFHLMCNFLQKNVVVTVVFVTTFENGEELFIRVCFSFFVLFFTQNQLPELIIGLSSLLYDNTALSK